jgi:hypothetical protein
MTRTSNPPIHELGSNLSQNMPPRIMNNQN